MLTYNFHNQLKIVQISCQVIHSKKKNGDKRNESLIVKGQTKSKWFFQADLSSKNERMNSILLLWDLFLFIFWRKLKAPKRHFEIKWPLSCYFLLYWKRKCIKKYKITFCGWTKTNKEKKSLKNIQLWCLSKVL